jgi:uncharacterized protein (DUF58 family)
VREHTRTVALLPRRRVHGTPLGDMRSGRRGDGAELVGLRPYRRGDDLRRLDHRASARASRARGDDVLLVREFYAEEAARVVVVLDQRPSMQLFPRTLPWLHKPEAVREIVKLLAASALEARAPVACLAGAQWWPPARRPRTEDWQHDGGSAPALAELARTPRLGKGTFVFVVSDFLDPPSDDDWWRLLARGWDPVPIVVQDPSWEQSFPDVAGVPLPVAAADGSRARLVRVTRREARALRESHEARSRTTLERLQSLTLEPVCVGTSDPAGVHLAFKRWSAARGGRLR